ncbi:putative necrosis-inducing factor-domain-containing protein [Neurospora tetraspora]|uniref:Necrosis-inducing factor-domain-containing protein n=1 Tax=Neurospora tetraspora TaxID=94610 RepID=A0AAE0JEN8_9PEZI|nr:putative necrosis-inducing factor-domain-containing protein [Neurospora tetraspora]
MQLPTNLLTLLLTSTFLSLITATPIVSPSGTNPVDSSVPADANINVHVDDDPNDPAIAFFSSLPPPRPKRSPNPSSPSATGLVKFSKRGGNKDFCRGGGIFNKTSDGSPWVDDCKIIIQNISPNGGTWHYMTGTQRTLVSHKSCALGIESTDGVPKALQTLVGDLDITEWIQKSIDRFRSSEEQGKVGSYGDTQCISQTFKGDEYSLRWGLYRNKGY